MESTCTQVQALTVAAWVVLCRLSEQQVTSFVCTAVMENNLSEPIYSTDGLWLQRPIYLLLWESRSERG